MRECDLRYNVFFRMTHAPVAVDPIPNPSALGPSKHTTTVFFYNLEYISTFNSYNIRGLKSIRMEPSFLDAISELSK